MRIILIIITDSSYRLLSALYHCSALLFLYLNQTPRHREQSDGCGGEEEWRGLPEKGEGIQKHRSAVTNRDIKSVIL